MGAFDNNWGANTLGVTLTWYDSEYCHIVRQAVYLNANQNWTAEQIRSVATHELGHYLIYGHNWYNVSVMGYTYSTTPPMTFLTADDHSFLRTLYPSGNQAEANVHIHPYVLVSAVGIPIVEDQLSYTTSPPPTCSGGCQNVRPGDTISVILTYGNTGNTDTSGPVEFSATLGGVEIGHWSVSSGLPAHAWSTYEFTATVSSSVPTGTNAFELWIDPDYTYASGYGPSAGRYVSYPGFVTPCDPACTDNECSADGCGGSCGTCSGAGVCEVTGQYTHQGLTRYTSRCVCEPQCLGRQCGDDGCGGTCGSCGFGTTHCVNGQCRECGSDWDCASGEMCTPLGCQPIDQSSGAPKAGCGCATPVEHSGTLLVAAVLLFLLLRRRFRQYRS